MTVEQDQVSKVGACWECGYSLRGLTESRCPECGRAFDPADERTMNMGRDVRWLARFFMKPPGWGMHLLTALAVSMSLWAAAVPVRRGHYAQILTNLALLENWDGETAREIGAEMAKIGSGQGHFLIAASIWLVVGLSWIGRRVARGITVKRLSKQRAAPLACWRRWLVTPVVFAVTVMLCRSRLPVYAGFWLSKPWLDQEVKEALAGNSRSRAWTTDRNGVKIPMALARVFSRRAIGIYLFDEDHEVAVTRDDVAIILPGGGAFVFRDDGEFPDRRPTGEVGWPLSNGHAQRVSRNWFLVEPDQSGE